MPEDEWVNDRGEVAAVAEMLIAVGIFTAAKEMLDYIEKPWKWSRERSLWVAAGRPGPADPSWEPFIEQLEQGN